MAQIVFTHVEKSLRRAGRGGITAPATGRSFGGGQFIPADLWQAEQEKARASLPGIVQDLAENLDFLRQVYEQNVALRKLPGAATALGSAYVPASTIEARIKTAIRDTYRRAFEAGKRATGNLLGITADDEKVLQKTRQDEYQYLRAFLADIEAGKGRMSYQERMQWYAAASRELYWLGFALGDDSDQRGIRWRLGETEQHCSDCAQLTGEYSRARFAAMVRETGLVPQSGKLGCKGFKCGCSLINADVDNAVLAVG